MTLRLIGVECYAGGRADERPRRLTIDGRQHTVARLLKESVEESRDDRQQTRRYKVLTDEGLVLEIVRCDGDWYLDS
jgi:hypothetical protein